MTNSNKILQLAQIDKKIAKLSVLRDLEVPPRGWIHAIRRVLNMSLSQLGRRLKKTAPTVKEIEDRESEGSITIGKLQEVGDALDLRLVYAFLPKESSLERMVEKRALELARSIVMRTSQSMGLEDQENTKVRLEKAIQDRARKIRDEMPKYLWD